MIRNMKTKSKNIIADIFGDSLNKYYFFIVLAVYKYVSKKKPREFVIL